MFGWEQFVVIICYCSSNCFDFRILSGLFAFSDLRNKLSRVAVHEWRLQKHFVHMFSQFHLKFQIGQKFPPEKFIYIGRISRRASSSKYYTCIYLPVYRTTHLQAYLVLWAASLEVWSLILPTTTTQLQPHLAWLPGGHRSYNPGSYRDDPFWWWWRIPKSYIFFFSCANRSKSSNLSLFHKIGNQVYR